MTTMTVTAGAASKTTTGVERGLDVTLTVTLPDGREIEGEVTLLPAADGRPEYESWGSADQWVESRLLAAVRAAYPDYREFREALSEIEAAASAECGLPE